MNSEQARPDRKHLYGIMAGAFIAGGVVFGYILMMTGAGRELDAAWDKKRESMGFETVEAPPRPPVKSFENASCPPRAIGTKAPDPSICQ